MFPNRLPELHIRRTSLGPPEVWEITNASNPLNRDVILEKQLRITVDSVTGVISLRDITSPFVMPESNEEIFTLLSPVIVTKQLHCVSLDNGAEPYLCKVSTIGGDSWLTLMSRNPGVAPLIINVPTFSDVSSSTTTPGRGTSSPSQRDDYIYNPPSPSFDSFMG